MRVESLIGATWRSAALAALVLACTGVAGPTPTVTPTPWPTFPPTPSAPPSTATPTRDPSATPTPSPIDLRPVLTAEMTVVNLADRPLRVTVTAIDPESLGEFEVGAYELAPEQVTAQRVLPLRYRLDFRLAPDIDLGTCTIDVAEAEQLQFAVVGAGVVLTTNGAEPADAAEMVAATSSRCGAGEDA
jgi:hypothetical protein